MSTIEGVDYSFGRPSSPSALYNAGKRFACRYLSFDDGKNLTLAEANGLAAASVWEVANWEQSGTGATAPEDAAAKSLSLAHSLKIPNGRPIYASADFNVQSGQYDDAQNWITRFHKALGGEYDGRAMYGSYYLIKNGFDEGWLKWGWQTYAWSDGNRDPRAQLYQHLNGQTVAGCSVDLDTAYHDDYGQWMPGKLPDGVDDVPLDDKDAATVWDHKLKIWNNSTPQADTVLSNVHENLQTDHLRSVTWRAPLDLWNDSTPAAESVLSNIHQVVHGMATQLNDLAAQVAALTGQPAKTMQVPDIEGDQS